MRPSGKLGFRDYDHLVAVTIFSVCGTGECSTPNATTKKTSPLPGDNQWGGFSWQVAQGVDQSRFTAVNVNYPAQGFWLGNPIDYLGSVAIGVQVLAGLITGSSGNFVLSGYSQGAQVVSEVLMQLLSGSLKAHLPRLVAGVTFGNPMRQAGRTWRGDPGVYAGQGINTQQLLSSVPLSWWDMTNTYDLAGNVPPGAVGATINQVRQDAGTIQLTSITQLMTYLLTATKAIKGSVDRITLIETIVWLTKAVANANTTGHACFDTATVGKTGLTFVQTAINYLNSIT